MLDAFIMEFKVCDERTEKSLEPAPAPAPALSPGPLNSFLKFPCEGES